jgi:hypothetical protein
VYREGRHERRNLRRRLRIKLGLPPPLSRWRNNSFFPGHIDIFTRDAK